MLVVMLIFTGGSWIEKDLLSLDFCFLDLFYYLSLYILIKWPPKLTTLMSCFYIPMPWSPGLVPIKHFGLTILVIALLAILGII